MLHRIPRYKHCKVTSKVVQELIHSLHKYLLGAKVAVNKTDMVPAPRVDSHSFTGSTEREGCILAWPSVISRCRACEELRMRRAFEVQK